MGVVELGSGAVEFVFLGEDAEGLLDLLGEGTGAFEALAELGLVELAVAGRADEGLDLVFLLGGVSCQPVEEDRLHRQWESQQD